MLKGNINKLSPELAINIQSKNLGHISVGGEVLHKGGPLGCTSSFLQGEKIGKTIIF